MIGEEQIDVQHRDAFDSLAAMRDAGGVDLILTSPPYPDARTDEAYGASFDTSMEGYGRLGEAIFAALKPGGVCALNIDGPVRKWRNVCPNPLADGAEIGSERSLIAFEVAIDWAKRVGFRYLERCSYARETVPGRRGPRWRGGEEPVHVFARPGGDVYFDPWGATRPSTRPGGASVGGWSIHRDGRRRRSGYEQGERKQLSTCITVRVDVNDHAGHPAPFAHALADAFVLCYSQPGDIVGDPFVGSGTVAESCHRHGRLFVGGDLGHRDDGKRWADIARDKLR